MIEFHIYGDSAVLINFEQKINPAVNEEVLALMHAVESAAITGVLHCIPAYSSLSVVYNPLQLKYDLLVSFIKNIIQQKKDLDKNKNQRKLLIPVCYNDPHSLDLNELEIRLNISKKEIIEKHTQTIFQVYMLGFLPGFPYMGILPKQLVCERKKNPRLKVPARSVGLAGQQTGIYPIEAPGGWQIIGQTPLTIFNAKNDHSFLFDAGDQVQFYSISNSEFDKIEKDIVTGNFNFQEIYDQN